MELQVQIIPVMQKTLFSAMDSVMNIMREVELQEKDAQQAQEEAAKGGLDILTKVGELKQMLQHAKEANGMVVYLFIRRCMLIYNFFISVKIQLK